MSFKNAADLSGPLVVAGSVLIHNLPGIVTVIGGFLSIVWYGIRLYDRFVLNRFDPSE